MLLPLCTSLLVCIVTPALALEAIKVESFTLKNGLQVKVIPNHRVPAVSQMIWFPTGGADDPHGRSGLTHFHEHAMFKGTAKFAAGEFERTISALGGEHNAFTSYDTTAYYINIDKAHLATAMQFEADRLSGLKPDAEDMIKEREVIMEERRMRTDNVPQALFAEQMRAALFVHHPYGTPLIGWQHEMQQLTMQEVLDFHDRYYRVNHALLVLAGDITLDEARPMVEQYYGHLTAGEALPPRVWTEEPPRRADKTLTMHHPLVRETQWQQSYAAASVVHGDTAQALPLMVLAQALGGGQTSLLYRELVVDKKIATSVDADYSGFSLGPASFDIRVTPAPNIAPEVVARTIADILARAKTTPFSAEDIARAKTLLKAETIYAREGLQGMATLVGFTHMLGLPEHYIHDWAALVDAVTAESMQQAAAKTLVMEGRITGMLLPEQVGGQ